MSEKILGFDLELDESTPPNVLRITGRTELMFAQQIAELTAELATVRAERDRLKKAACDFVWYPENWEGYKDLQTSTSMDLPVEFMNLCDAVADLYGEPQAALDGGKEAE